jgi:thiamine-phosphate pyrophosphorylase
VTLPALLVLTDRTQCPGGDLLSTVDAAVGAGARAVVLREKDLPTADRGRLAADLRALLAPVGGTLVVAGPAPAGVATHLAARDPFPTDRPGLVGRSCHDAAELRAAAAEGCDYVTVSPVFASASKPGYGPALGLDGLAALAALVAAHAATPVYALAGVRPDDVPGCLAAGAHGVAVMGTVMRDPRTVKDYLAALSGAAA